ncbi:MAG TPA: hypothetical protein VE986_04860, partial [Hyphomicrobiales bacterium]|nr:hypothetical protein [Hyphomicrobiales bacterium]
MLRKLIVAIVRVCSLYPWPVLAIAAALTVASANYVANNFAVNTDISKLISGSLPWRQREEAFAKAFPKQETAILAVID